MSEQFSVKPDGKYWAIWWGPTLICTSWSDRTSAEALCHVLETLRWADQLDDTDPDSGELGFGAVLSAWALFRDIRQAGR
jgi:hypothetical protein